MSNTIPLITFTAINTTDIATGSPEDIRTLFGSEAELEAVDIILDVDNGVTTKFTVSNADFSKTLDCARDLVKQIQAL